MDVELLDAEWGQACGPGAKDAAELVEGEAVEADAPGSAEEADGACLAGRGSARIAGCRVKREVADGL